jgi:hypothetical protein
MNLFVPALSAFVGCFAALIALAEVTIANKLVKYLVALLLGVLVTFALAWALEAVAHVFARV